MKREITNKDRKDEKLQANIMLAITAAEKLIDSIEKEQSYINWVDVIEGDNWSDELWALMKLKAFNAFLNEIIDDMKWSGKEDNKILVDKWNAQVDDTYNIISKFIKDISMFLTTISSPEAILMATAFYNLNNTLKEHNLNTEV